MTKLRWLVLLLLLIAPIALVSQQPPAGAPAKGTPATTQDNSDKDAEARRVVALAKRERADALEYVNQYRYSEAIPILEKLVAADPKDAELNYALGIALVSETPAITDSAARKQHRARARAFLAKAKELGNNENLLEYYLGTIPQDGGSDTVFSDRKEVQEAMQQGETSFAKKDFDGAVKAYIRAMLLDPNLYSPVLFVGDSYYADQKYGSAAEWFARAIKLDPNRETAYRYWGDTLLVQGKNDEARSKFIDGIVANPYEQRSWAGISQWAKKVGVEFNIPIIKSPNSVKAEGGKTNITMNINSLNKNDGSSAWMLYDLSKAMWMTETFFKEFPNEKKYRHSLKEESDLLHLVATSAREQLKSKKVKLDPALAMLVKLDDAGLVEPYILFFLPDEGIAKDYSTYREKNRDKLRRYLDEFAIPKTPTK